MNGKEIKELRHSLCLSQEKFGALIGMTCATIGRWEKETYKPSPLALEKLKKIMPIEKHEKKEEKDGTI